jgi:hypothetical protein
MLSRPMTEVASDDDPPRRTARRGAGAVTDRAVIPKEPQ